MRDLKIQNVLDGLPTGGFDAEIGQWDGLNG